MNAGTCASGTLANGTVATKKATEGAPRTGAAPLKSQRGGDGVQDTVPATKKKGGIAGAAKKLIGRKK